jgi:7-cyano-7-deazaguanine synthase
VSIARRAKVVEHRFFDLPGLREAGDIPGRKWGGLPPTFIPMRNAIFYSIAAGYALEARARYLVGGHNRDDHRVFEDTSPEFFDTLQHSFLLATQRLHEHRLRIVRPLEHLSKQQVILRAARLGVPLELTWSCHRAGNVPCWNCEGCSARTSAFQEARVPDPLRSAIGKSSHS